MAKRIDLIHGPNLNLLGSRRPDVYGKQTLAELERVLQKAAEKEGYDLVLRQSNHEGELIDWIHEAGRISRGILLNAGAFSHYSYALRDAIEAVNVPVIEVHLSNIYARESFRAHSVLAPVCRGHVSGLGIYGYHAALQALIAIQGEEIE